MQKFLKGLFGLLVFLVLLAVIGRILLFELVTTDSFSMIPTLVPGDLFLVFTRGEIGPGEVVVCKNPRNPGSMVVGRVLGVPGSTFAIVRDTPVINDVTKEIMMSATSMYVDNTSGEFLQYLINTNYETVGGHEYRVAHMDRAGEKDYPLEEMFRWTAVWALQYLWSGPVKTAETTSKKTEFLNGFSNSPVGGCCCPFHNSSLFCESRRQ